MAQAEQLQKEEAGGVSLAQRSSHTWCPVLEQRGSTRALGEVEPGQEAEERQGGSERLLRGWPVTTWPLLGMRSSGERGLSLQPPSEQDGGKAPGLDLDSPPRW